MRNKRLWIALLAIPISLASLLIIGAQRSHPANAGGVIDPTCTSPNPCIQYTNKDSGAAIEALSRGGNGLFGVTTFKSTSSSNGAFGVFGDDVSTSGTFDSGVRGLSVRGSGVSGNSTSGAGVSGTSSSFHGVFGTSSSADGVLGMSSTGVGVVGFTSGPNQGVVGNAPNGTGVVGMSTKGAGVEGTSASGIGVSARSTNFVGVNVVGGHDDTAFGIFTPALSVVGNGATDLIDACRTGTNPCISNVAFPPPQFELTSSGDVFITGQIFTHGSCSAGCFATALSGEKKVRFYTPQESLPTVEDFGSAQLVSGRAYVRIDAAFANTMDPLANYMVFITPEGPSRGLYVTQKSTTGFAVRENPGGNSTIAFSYRIVAKPFGEHPVRLQMFTMAEPAAYPKQPTRTR